MFSSELWLSWTRSLVHALSDALGWSASSIQSAYTWMDGWPQILQTHSQTLPNQLSSFLGLCGYFFPNSLNHLLYSTFLYPYLFSDLDSGPSLSTLPSPQAFGSLLLDGQGLARVISPARLWPHQQGPCWPRVLPIPQGLTWFLSQAPAKLMY